MNKQQFLGFAQEEREAQRWLQSFKSWDQPHLEAGWNAKKILGQGGQGIVGLWEYEGDEDKDKFPVKKLVIKQGLADDIGLERENYFLNTFQSRPSKTKHLPRIYNKDVIMEQGQETGKIDSGMVRRLVLEYCEGGSLHSWLQVARRQAWEQDRFKEFSLEESKLWEMFYCFARALTFFHHGDEDLRVERWDKTDFVHFDLKFDNVLVGSPENDEEHSSYPPMKISDLGSSLFVMVPENQTEELWRTDYGWRGTMYWVLPEQARHYNRSSGYRTLLRPWLEDKITDGTGLSAMCFQTREFGSEDSALKYGTSSNIWQVGLMMWCAMRCVPHPKWSKMKLYKASFTEADRKATYSWTVGDQEDEDFSNKKEGVTPKYSKALISTVAHCLFLEQRLRINIEELVKVTKAGRDESRAAKERAAKDAVGVNSKAGKDGDDVASDSSDQPDSAALHALAQGQILPPPSQTKNKADNNDTTAPQLDTLHAPEPLKTSKEPNPVNRAVGTPSEKARAALAAAQDRAREVERQVAERTTHDEDDLSHKKPYWLSPNSRWTDADPFKMKTTARDPADPGRPAPLNFNINTGLTDAMENVNVNIDPVPPTDAELIPRVTFMVQTRGFLVGLTTKTIVLDNLMSNMFVAQAKALLVTKGCQISALHQKMMNGRTIFTNNQRVKDLVGKGTVIRVIDELQA